MIYFERILSLFIYRSDFVAKASVVQAIPDTLAVAIIKESFTIFGILLQYKQYLNLSVKLLLCDKKQIL